MRALTAYFGRCWLALDILANVLLGGDVETISSRMGRALATGRRCLLCGLLCGLLDVFWPGHCLNNIMAPLNKR